MNCDVFRWKSSWQRLLRTVSPFHGGCFPCRLCGVGFALSSFINKSDSSPESIFPQVPACARVQPWSVQLRNRAWSKSSCDGLKIEKRDQTLRLGRVPSAPRCRCRIWKWKRGSVSGEKRLQKWKQGPVSERRQAQPCLQARLLVVPEAERCVLGPAQPRCGSRARGRAGSPGPALPEPSSGAPGAAPLPAGPGGAPRSRAGPWRLRRRAGGEGGVPAGAVPAGGRAGSRPLAFLGLDVLPASPTPFPAQPALPRRRSPEKWRRAPPLRPPPHPPPHPPPEPGRGGAAAMGREVWGRGGLPAPRR